MAIEVFWGSGSPYAWRVLLTLEIKRIPYISKRLRFSDKELKSDEFLAINPRGKVPAIRDGTYTLYESIAIMRYLEDIKPEPVLFGKSAAERGLIWCSIMECLNYIEPPMVSFVGPIFSGQLVEKLQETIQFRQSLENELNRINEILCSRDYLTGNHLTAADIALYPIIQIINRATIKDSTEEVCGRLVSIATNYPFLDKWCKKIEELPGYERTYPPHWKEKSSSSQ